MQKISTVLIVVMLFVLAFRGQTSDSSAPLAQETATATVVVLPPPPPELPPGTATAPPSATPSLPPTKTPTPSRTPTSTITPTATRTATPTATTGVTPGPGDRTYTVVSGDNPWLIATRLYGNGFFYQYILKANHLTEKSVLQVGMVLVIPPLPTPTPAPGIVSATLVIAATLPPATVPIAAPVSPSPALTATTVTGLVSITPGAVTPETAARAVPPGPQPPVATTPAAVMSTTGAQDPLGRLVADAARNPQMPLVLDVLGWACVVGSLVCAWMSYQTYHRVRILRRMMIMSARARARL